METFRIATDWEAGKASRMINDFRLLYTGERRGNDFASKIAVILADARTYMSALSLCTFDPGVVFRLHGTAGVTEVMICFRCSEMLILATREGKETERLMAPCGLVYGALVRLAQEAFPEDGDVALLGTRRSALE